MRTLEHVLKLRQVQTRYAPEFRRVFGIDLHRPFFDCLLGLDLVAFDTWLKAGDQAIKDVVEARFGAVGVTLLADIMAAEMRVL